MKYKFPTAAMLPACNKNEKLSVPIKTCLRSEKNKLLNQLCRLRNFWQMFWQMSETAHMWSLQPYKKWLLFLHKFFSV